MAGRDRSLDIVVDGVRICYTACPNHAGHSFHTFVGPCSCGSSHSLLDRPTSREK